MTEEPAAGLIATPMIGVLLTVRFLLELALPAAYAVTHALLRRPGEQPLVDAPPHPPA